MKFTQPSFTVPTGHRPAAACDHGWSDTHGHCVFCGAQLSPCPRCGWDESEHEYVQTMGRRIRFCRAYSK